MRWSSPCGSSGKSFLHNTVHTRGGVLSVSFHHFCLAAHCVSGGNDLLSEPFGGGTWPHIFFWKLFFKSSFYWYSCGICLVGYIYVIFSFSCWWFFESKMCAGLVYVFLLVVISPDLCFYLALNNLRQSYFLSSLWFFATRLLVWQIYYFFCSIRPTT